MAKKGERGTTHYCCPDNLANDVAGRRIMLVEIAAKDESD